MSHDTPSPAPAPAGTACLNCETILVGEWCHHCGQEGGPPHRTVWELCGEFFEMLTHADSRFSRTIRTLALAPARLTQDYIDGRRVSMVPPIRMFFVVLLAMFTIHALLATGHHGVHITATDRAELAREIGNWSWAGHERVTAWVRMHMLNAVDNPTEVLNVMREWSERFILVMLPISALILWGLYYWPTRRALYDHVIFSVHSLSFAFAVFTVSSIAVRIVGHAGNLLLLVPPVHLYRHLRGFYGVGVPGTITRMTILFVASLVFSLILLSALGLLGLELGAGGES
ncbi:DUF3667 domain-containing protein [Nguyenibacter sp. L1]|uniref:DUF3667 domain-containing protein n=1 Tax=Nguyenibacter sp. L1 TaxID=3049350 RepID=UPI002B4925B1|nr:DUF3667 domain-containing protein [Nguyenibacter sp. L1]WRH89460.1 DUF3667 domain-containing protein [Nguyenibacter sp. L1]